MSKTAVNMEFLEPRNTLNVPPSIAERPNTPSKERRHDRDYFPGPRQLTSTFEAYFSASSPIRRLIELWKHYQLSKVVLLVSFVFSLYTFCTALMGYGYTAPRLERLNLSPHLEASIAELLRDTIPIHRLQNPEGVVEYASVRRMDEFVVHPAKAKLPVEVVPENTNGPGHIDGDNLSERPTQEISYDSMEEEVPVSSELPPTSFRIAPKLVPEAAVAASRKGKPIKIDPKNPKARPSKLKKNKKKKNKPKKPKIKDPDLPGRHDYDAGYQDSQAAEVDELINHVYVAQIPHETYLRKLTELSPSDRDRIKLLKAEQMAGDESLDITCGNWQADYIRRHVEMMDVKQKGKFITYVCDKNSNCGGLADRVLGMTSTFFFALMTGRTFLAEWQAPVPLEMVFDSPNVDWSFDSSDPDVVLRMLDTRPRDIDIIHFNAPQMDRLFAESSWDQKWPEPWLRMFTNRGMIIRSFEYQQLRPKLMALGLKPHTAFSCILDFLFRPHPSALDFITDYTALLALPNIFSIGIQIRTGDTSMINPAYDQSNTIEKHDNFFRCADQIAKTFAMPDQRVVYFLITDSEHLRQDAVERLQDRTIVSGLPIEHIHKRRGHVDGVHNAIIENWILAKTTYRVISQGGYGKLATFHSKRLHSTVLMFPNGNVDLQGIYQRPAPDCSREDAFTTFREMANEWSLG